MWDSLIRTLQANATVEFGMLQLARQPDCPSWRRHRSPNRFEHLHNALFSDKGAYAACTGKSAYPKQKYSMAGQLVVPFAAAWDLNTGVGFLVRAAVPYPEITIVAVDVLEAIEPVTEHELLNQLSWTFGTAAGDYGVRWLTKSNIQLPTNEC
ncbi:hypothetical protein [Pseudomonas chlororaphis]|uniref:hypothetical protein n=1 Tax=Pseudomonas chlororaphis TaxID=587753 RepID=UPI000F58CBD3|nr:hypothetical protein [Pseudomonas chlororaphis]